MNTTKKPTAKESSRNHTVITALPKRKIRKPFVHLFCTSIIFVVKFPKCDIIQLSKGVIYGRHENTMASRICRCHELRI